MISARVVGGLAYGCAAAAAGLGALALSGDMINVRTAREVAPLAFVIGAVSGYGVVSSWPRRLGPAMLTGAVTALTALVFFSALYLFGDAVIEAARGRADEAVVDARTRLSERLPIGAPLAIGGFAAAGALLWMLAAIGRLFQRKPRAGGA